jgi:hypothetical protein
MLLPKLLKVMNPRFIHCRIIKQQVLNIVDIEDKHANHWSGSHHHCPLHNAKFKAMEMNESKKVCVKKQLKQAASIANKKKSLSI